MCDAKKRSSACVTPGRSSNACVSGIYLPCGVTQFAGGEGGEVLTPVVMLCFVSSVGGSSEIGVVAEVMFVWASESECVELLLVSVLMMGVGECGEDAQRGVCIYICRCGVWRGPATVPTPDCTRPPIYS